MREIVFDTETTGLSPAGGDRMVEIGCIELFNRVETGQVFHAYICPDRTMPMEAHAVHGLSDAFLAAKPRFADIVHELTEFISDSPLIAHNASFDFGFLNHEMALCARDPVCLSRMICTLAMARQRHPGAKHSLDALCTRYGIDRSHRVLHGALLDAQLLAQLYVELMGGRQIGLGLDAAAPEPLAAPSIGAQRTVVIRPTRPHHASPVERAAHAAFIATLADPLWPVAATANGPVDASGVRA